MPSALHRTDLQPQPTLQVTRLEPTIGAEISGIDLSQPLPCAMSCANCCWNTK
jgi:taurine dioxygenase